MIPYPLRATAFSLRFFVFGWNALHFRYRNDLTEAARESGETIWWLRVGPVQLSYARAL
jgi:hypothetical protein